jgi:acyl-CoA dehydrogenase
MTTQLVDDLFSEGLSRLLQDHCISRVVRDIEAGGPAKRLWRQIEESGFADVMLDESAGGAGLGLADIFPLVELCGTYALPVPLAETMLARRLLADAGVGRPAGSICLAEAVIASDGSLACAAIGCGRVADWVLVQCATENLLLAVAAARQSPAIFPLDANLEWNAPAVASADRVPGAFDLRTLSACVYAAQLAGVLMSVFSRTLQYANDRRQFGRPIGKFQAVQHQLSVISEHAFAARMAAQIGCRGDGITPNRLAVAVAKARTSEAALETAALAHSIHGAIGFTEEYDLQLFTRRLHAWRQACGSESYWHTVLGSALIDHHSGPAVDLARAITDT